MPKHFWKAPLEIFPAVLFRPHHAFAFIFSTSPLISCCETLDIDPLKVDRKKGDANRGVLIYFLFIFVHLFRSIFVPCEAGS